MLKRSVCAVTGREAFHILVHGHIVVLEERLPLVAVPIFERKFRMPLKAEPMRTVPTVTGAGRVIVSEPEVASTGKRQSVRGSAPTGLFGPDFVVEAVGAIPSPRVSTRDGSPATSSAITVSRGSGAAAGSRICSAPFSVWNGSSFAGSLSREAFLMGVDSGTCSTPDCGQSNTCRYTVLAFARGAAPRQVRERAGGRAVDGLAVGLHPEHRQRADWRRCPAGSHLPPSAQHSAARCRLCSKR